MKTLSIIFAILLFIAGCQAVAILDGNLTHDDGNSTYDAECRSFEEFQDVIRAGMPLGEAMRILENRGFAKCAEPGPLRQIAEDGTECLTLIRQMNSGRLDVKIYSQAGKVKYFRTTHFSDTIQMHQFDDATRDDVVRFVSPQMPVDEAVRTLAKQGFKRIPHSEYYSNSRYLPASVTNPKWMIFEKRFRPGGFPSTVEIRILPENGKVKEVEADTLPLATI